jgi:PAS domain S-box-containing protein
MFGIKPIRRAWLRYALAIVLVLVAAAIRMWFMGGLGERAPFVTFLGAVILAALFGGFFAGLFATLLSVCFAAMIQSSGQPYFALTPVELRYMSLAVFTFVGITISWAFKESHRTRVRAHEADALSILATEMEEANKALRKNRAILSSTIESLPFDFLAIGRDGRFFLMNSNAKRNWGDVMDKRPEEITASPETLATWQECYTRALAGEIVQKETAFHRFGEDLVTECVVAPIWEGHHIIGALGLNIDITERKKIEKHLKESEERWRMYVETASEGVFTMDADTRITYVNRRFAEMIGSKPEDIIGKYVVEYAFPEDIPDVRKRVQNRSEGFSERYERRLKRKDGSAIWTLLSAIPLQGKDGSFQGSFAMFIDITDRKLAEETLKKSEAELRRLNEEAQAASRAKSEFLANMSHEIRTPLSAILGLTELSQRVTDPEKISANLGMIAESAKTLLDIIGDVLDLSRVEAGKLTLVVKPFDLRQIMEKALAPYRLVFRDKNLDLKLEIPDTVPFSFMGDPVRLGQVIANLIGNAAKFTQQGGIAVSVDVSGRPARGVVELHFQIADTGIGIAPELREVIFESFRQADSSFSKSYQGVGLGLAICRELTALMGGKIWVESTPGKGSTFHFTGIFPLAEERETSETISTTGSLSPSPLRVLVVEDNPVNLRVFTHFLASMGHLVTTASDGLEALTQLGSTEFDLVFLDVQMPKLDGIEVVRRLRAGECGKRAEKVPVVALTAYAMASDRERFLQAGMTGYLSKPVSMDALQAAIVKYASTPVEE